MAENVSPQEVSCGTITIEDTGFDPGAVVITSGTCGIQPRTITGADDVLFEVGVENGNATQAAVTVDWVTQPAGDVLLSTDGTVPAGDAGTISALVGGDVLLSAVGSGDFDVSVRVSAREATLATDVFAHHRSSTGGGLTPVQRLTRRH